MSLARALSKFGVCSRKQAADWVAAGRVAVDGRACLDPRARLDPRRRKVTVDGHAVGDLQEVVVIALHKPPGYVTSRAEPGGRPVVYDLLSDFGGWVFPVGRLDRDSGGLLILTNDHRLGQRLTDPAAHVPKTYHARVRGTPDAEALRALREGVPLEDGVTRPARVRALGTDRRGGSWLEIVLTEGRNRQVRRMCAAVGHEVQELVRVGIGRFLLGDLPAGRWRRLRPPEVQALGARGRGVASAP
ncbi:MAG TPA: pseudouridine synthase [Vicinamibacteria bacterium]